MKIAFITSTMFSLGNGPANFAVNLYNRTKQSQDWDLKFITEDINEDLPKIEKIELHNYFPLGLIPILKRILNYTRVAKKQNVDVLVWNFSVMSCLYLWKNKKHNEQNVVFVNDPYSTDLQQNFPKSLSQLRYKVFRILERYSCIKAEKIIVNSLYLKERVVGAYGIDDSKVYILHKGIELEHVLEVKKDYCIDKFNPVKISFLKSDYIAGGLQLLFDSLSQLKDLKFEVFVMGPKTLPGSFFKYNNIETHHLGKVGKVKINEILIESDIFFIPNKLEAFGQASVEAMATGVPVVLLPIRFQQDIHDDSYCYFTDSLEINDVSKKIRELIELPAKIRLQKAIEARRVVNGKYTIGKSLQTLDKILRA